MKKDNAQLYLFIGIGGLILFLILIFTGVLPGLQTASDKGANLVMWGFEDSKNVWQPIITKFQDANQKIKIQYIQKNPATFEAEFVNTIAVGTPTMQVPDIVVFPSDYFRRQVDKLALSPVGLITEQQLRANYIDAEGQFWSPGARSLVGLPLYGDALVLYSNNGLLTKHFITQPPTTWDDFLKDSQQITKKDESGNIIVAGAAMGRARNIKNASDIITALFLQFGDEIVDSTGRTVLGQTVTQGNVQVNPAESALQFFGNFANPKKNTYSWSFSLPEAQDMFLAGKLGFYLGFMSEYTTLREKNPHLDITISPIPQLTDAPRPITTGRLYVLAVPRAAKAQTQPQAWVVIKYLTDPEGGQEFASALKTVLPRRDVLPLYSSEAIRSVFAKSMLALKLWRVPEPNATKDIFNTMIEDLAFGRGSTADVIRNAAAQLNRVNIR